MRLLLLLGGSPSSPREAFDILFRWRAPPAATSDASPRPDDAAAAQKRFHRLKSAMLRHLVLEPPAGFATPLTAVGRVHVLALAPRHLPALAGDNALRPKQMFRADAVLARRSTSASAVRVSLMDGAGEQSNSNDTNDGSSSDLIWFQCAALHGVASGGSTQHSFLKTKT